ncbi:MAG: hypothetical protein QOJ86_3344 [Bradyrhizobium sp.]|nr:hypothetical protein [Bradyrhizobium sp.]
MPAPRSCGKAAQSAPRQLPHHVRGVKSDCLAEFYQFDHVDSALAGFHVRDPGMIDAHLLRQIDLSQPRFLALLPAFALQYRSINYFALSQRDVKVA